MVHSCVLGVAFHSATQVEPWSKKSQREETTSTKQTSVLLHSRCCQFSHSFFLQCAVFLCFIALNFCAHFSLKKLNNSNIDWQRQQQLVAAATTTTKRKSLNSRSFWAQVVALRNLLLLLATKVPHPERYTSKTGRLHGQGLARHSTLVVLLVVVCLIPTPTLLILPLRQYLADFLRFSPIKR